MIGTRPKPPPALVIVGAGNDVLQLLQLAVQRFISLDDLLAVFVERLSLACEPEFFLASLDKQRLERAFQRTDLLADGGLRDLIDLRGFGETFRFGQIAKHLETLNLHKFSLTTKSSTRQQPLNTY